MKREVDLPKEITGINLSQLTDYPPKFAICAYPLAGHKGGGSGTPQLVVEGLDIECCFEIITPGEEYSKIACMCSYTFKSSNPVVKSSEQRYQISIARSTQWMQIDNVSN